MEVCPSNRMPLHKLMTITIQWSSVVCFNFTIISACDLIFLGSVDVATLGSDAQLTQTVQQLQTLDLSSMNVVTITVSREGITLQENVNG